jgi:hypothetical protein
MCGEGKERVACCGFGGGVVKGISDRFCFFETSNGSNAGGMRVDSRCCWGSERIYGATFSSSRYELSVDVERPRPEKL